MFDLFDVIGISGTGLVIVCYFATQQGWLNASDWRFPAAVMEVFWVLISLYGLWRIKNQRKKL